MPTLSYCTVVRHVSDGFTLILNACHRLVVDTPTDVIYPVKGRLPSDLDVHLPSSLVIRFLGFVNGSRISSDIVGQSAVVAHFRRYLRMNAEQLGVGNVSGVHVDEADECPKVTLTCSRPLPINIPSPTITLDSIELVYSWKVSCTSDDYSLDAEPFSSQLLLPFETALDDITRKFVSMHLVRRYPFIFGPWRSKLDSEMHFVPSIARSVLSVIERSSNTTFRNKCRRVLKRLRKRIQAIAETRMDTIQELSQGCEPEDANPAEDIGELDDDAVLYRATVLLFSQSVRPFCFKTTRGFTVSSELDDTYPLVQQTIEPEATSSDLGVDDLVWDNDNAIALGSEHLDDVTSRAFHDEDNTADMWSNEQTTQDSRYEGPILYDGGLMENQDDDHEELWEGDDFDSPISSQKSSDNSQGFQLSDIPPCQDPEYDDFVIISSPDATDLTGNNSPFIHTPAFDGMFYNDWLPGGAAVEASGKEALLTRHEGTPVYGNDQEQGAMSTQSLSHVPLVDQHGDMEPEMNVALRSSLALDQHYPEFSEPDVSSAQGPEFFDDMSLHDKPQETNYERELVLGSSGIQSAVCLARRNSAFRGSSPAFISCLPPGDLVSVEELNVDHHFVLDFDEEGLAACYR
ncbi:hypothetical protein NEOLEDRAFT_1239359 [Neolentinus lepideus HHB14362 ss-1]|uniref:Uncharacterized protein n=1 Tax=Neolentinus lepideus HHB14362 ss-1 TaxID=1314782 RepID=A0A165UY80_9AGAM|nr:hypothetical protein NEOLEDRAFT_1239359 [Neolentinus lepideus HHB14362 ss-1]